MTAREDWPASNIGVPYGLVSLWDMINCPVFALTQLLSQLGRAESDFGNRIASGKVELAAPQLMALIPQFVGKSKVSAEDKSKLERLLGPTEAWGLEFGFEGTTDRVNRFKRTLSHQSPLELDHLLHEVRSLAEAIQDDAQKHRFYHYSRAKAAVVENFDKDWAEVLARFPNVREHALAATDCYALGHNTACVFHLMLVMEMGVRRLATRLNARLSRIAKNGNILELTWGEILNELAPKVERMPRSTRAQSARHQKYSEILSQLRDTKNAWRNSTMHPRAKGYNELEAMNVLNHVKSFMGSFTSIFPKRA